MINLPPYVLVDPAGGPNPTGQAIVWYGPTPGSDHSIPITVHGVTQWLYCFAPGFLF